VLYLIPRYLPSLPSELAPDWDTFVTDWCLGVPPVLSPDEVVQALDTLKRLLPIRFEQLRLHSDRGLGVVLPFIDLGSVTTACEELPGFHKLLSRLEMSDGSAISEAHYAAALVHAGCLPELEPQIGTGLLDTAIDWEGDRIYSEVIAPERAKDIVAAHADVQTLAGALCGAISGIVVEVLLHCDIGPDTLTRILDTLHDLPAGAPRTVEGFATIVQQTGVVPLIVSPSLPSPGIDPVLAAAVGRVEGLKATAGIVRMPLLDTRVRRLLSAELHHFSRDTRNILAIDISGVSIGPKNWAPLIQRSFQPNQNRRIGAVVFFSRGLVGIPLATRQIWAVVANEHAYCPIPRTFLDKLTSFDESLYFCGVPIPETV
jgi:hypothetical protein